MRRTIGVTGVVLVVMLAGCSSSGGESGDASAKARKFDDMPSTLSTTTTLPEAAIRQYASAVATAKPALDKQGSCTPTVACAIEGATAYVKMLGTFAQLNDDPGRPPELDGLVEAVQASRSPVSDAVDEVGSCVKAGDNGYNQTCTLEGIKLQRVLADIDLNGWSPYL